MTSPLRTFKFDRAASGFYAVARESDFYKSMSEDETAAHLIEVLAALGNDVGDTPFAVTKASRRYTLSLLYPADVLDAHGEFADAPTLEKATRDYLVKSAGDRRINLQHEDSGKTTIGSWVDAVAYPFETTVNLTKADGSVQKKRLPAGSVWLGVVWDEAAWPDVLAGKIGGLSLGGRAVKRPGALKSRHDFRSDDGRFMPAPTKAKTGIFRPAAQPKVGGLFAHHEVSAYHPDLSGMGSTHPGSTDAH